MNFTSRSLVLVTVCSLWSACEEDASKPIARGPMEAQTKIEAAKPEPKPEREHEALTTSAPSTPPTILDKAITAKSEEPPKPLPDEAKGEAAIDYDRPLDPEQVEVDRFVLAHGVEHREPVDPSDIFTTDTKKIFAFVQLANKAAPYAFRVHWEKVGDAPSPYGVKLTVPTSERYRTWSWTAIARAPGRYKAVLRTLDGAEIASREFTIDPAEHCID